MNPKEKARELIERFTKITYYDSETMETNIVYVDIERAKQCALIAVDEIIKELERSAGDYTVSHITDWWQEVKQEINNL